MERFKIRVSNEDESLRVQKELFRRGYHWSIRDKTPCHLKERFLFVRILENKRLSVSNHLRDFNNSSAKEITVEELFKESQIIEIEKYAKQWVNQATPPPCGFDDDPKRWSKWSDENDKKWKSFLKQLPSSLRKKFKSNVLGIKTSYWIPIPELKKQIEIEFKIKDLEEKGYVVTKEMAKISGGKR